MQNLVIRHDDRYSKFTHAICIFNGVWKNPDARMRMTINTRTMTGRLALVNWHHTEILRKKLHAIHETVKINCKTPQIAQHTITPPIGKYLDSSLTKHVIKLAH